MSATSEESPIPRWKERLLALLVGFVLMILGGEIFCRWQIHQANAHNLEAVLAGRTRPVEGTSQELTPATLGDVIRMGTNPKVVYEFYPNLQGVNFTGQELRTNHLGFRSAPLLLPACRRWRVTWPPPGLPTPISAGLT